MKKFITTVSLAIFIGSTLPMSVSADVETNAIYSEVLQASNDISRATQVLPDVEKLWPQDPATYVKSIRQIADVSSAALDNADAKQLFLNTFASLMQKPCPTNEDQAAQWISLKRDAVLFYLNSGVIRNDKSQWLAVAKFMGEIRSRLIPNYVSQGAMLSISSPSHPEITQAAIDENERKKIADKFQSELLQADSLLNVQLKFNCPYFQSSNATDTNFLDQVVSAAHLTAGEREKLRAGVRPPNG